MADQRIEVPDIGDATDVDVVEVLVEPGARIERDQPLIVLESEKASMEIPAPAGGVVKSVEVKVGDKVSQGSPILVLELSADAGAAPGAAADASVAKDDGQKPAPASAPEPQRASAPAEPARSPASEARAPTGPTRTIPPLPQEPIPEAPMRRGDKPHATPGVRKLARELGVELGQVTGSGPHGRITREDLHGHVKHTMSVVGTGAAGGLASPELPAVDFSQFGETAVQELTKVQRVSGRNLHRSWVTIPHVTQFDEADITELEEFRRKMKAERPEVKLTLLSFFMKAVVVVLRSMPRFNASLDPSGENLILKRYYNLGVAVDTPNGLMVPVIRDVDLKGLHDLASELAEVSQRARDRKLMPRDMQGGCFTISSLGGIGGTAFTPIINPPEVAVLGVSRASLRPTYVDGQIEARLICPLSLSYDHRVIDGADAARFTTRLREVLGDIRQMLL